MGNKQEQTENQEGGILNTIVNASAAVVDAVASTTHTAVEAVTHMIKGDNAEAQEKKEEAKEQASETREIAQEKGQEVKKDVQEKTEEAKEKGQEVKKDVQEKTEEAKTAAQEKGEEVKQNAGEAKEQAAEKVDEAKESAQKNTETDPAKALVNEAEHHNEHKHETHTFQLNGLPQNVSENLRHEVPE